MFVSDFLNIFSQPFGPISLAFIIFLFILIFISPLLFICLWCLLGIFSNYIVFDLGTGKFITFYGLSNIFFMVGISLKLLFGTPRFYDFYFKKYVFIFLLSSAISTFVSPMEYFLAIKGWFVYLNLFLLAILTEHYVHNEKQSKIVLQIIVWSSIFYSLVGFYQYIFRITDYSDFTLKTYQDPEAIYIFRVAGVANYASDYALYLMVPIFVLYVYYILSKKEKAYYLFFFILFFSLLITFTRAALLGVLVSLVICNSIVHFKKIISIFTYLSIIIIGYMLIDIILPGALVRKLSADSGRFETWSLAINELLTRKSILLGNGIVSGFNDAPTIISSHNIVLQFLLEIGIAGTLAFFYLVYNILKKSLITFYIFDNDMSKILSIILFTSTICYLINGMFVSRVFFSTVNVIHYWIILGLWSGTAKANCNDF